MLDPNRGCLCTVQHLIKLAVYNIGKHSSANVDSHSMQQIAASVHNGKRRTTHQYRSHQMPHKAMFSSGVRSYLEPQTSNLMILQIIIYLPHHRRFCTACRSSTTALVTLPLVVGKDVTRLVAQICRTFLGSLSRTK